MQEAILYTKPVHITSVDESCVYIINDIAKYVQDVFDALRNESPAEKIRLIKDVIPEKIITRPPSAELRPNQKDPVNHNQSQRLLNQRKANF